MSTSGHNAASSPARAGVPRPPALFDPSIAHPARVYAFWLGGKDHYPADREAGREVVRLRPEILAGARANRAFGQRVTRYAAAGAGIRQFLDIGAGLPAPGPTHLIAHGISSACRTVYADNDPLVTAHCQALLAAAPDAASNACIDADVRDPAGLLDSAREVLDFAQPVAVLILAVLHFLSDAEDPAGIVRQLAAILGDLPVKHPGIVPVSRWQPSLREHAPHDVDIYSAVAQVVATRVTEPPADAMAVAAEVARRAAEFPQHEITCEATLAGPCYVARGRSLSTHPYLVMTGDPGQLFAALTGDPP